MYENGMYCVLRSFMNYIYYFYDYVLFKKNVVYINKWYIRE